MSYHLDDTIAAIATAPGGGVRGMLRASGPATLSVVRKSFTPTTDDAFDSLTQATIVPGEIAVSLDGIRPHQLPCDLFLWPTDRSYTRQIVAEFHTLGSPPLVQAALDAICRAGARLAEPGEFTLRAFLAGRLDLTQAEAVLGVVDAEHNDELCTALGQLAGGLARPLHALRDELLGLLAELEAGLDFVEEDIEFISANEMTRRLHAVTTKIRDISAQMESRLSSTALPQVALFGAPNAGKSSLFNVLTVEFGANELTTSPPALVSEERGTTRDYLTATIDAAGMRLELVDTAGVEPDFLGGSFTADANVAQINTAAQTASRERSRQAVLRAVCIDSSTADARELLQRATEQRTTLPPADVIVLTKADLAPRQAWADACETRGIPIVISSSVTRQGLGDLCRVLSQLLRREGTRSVGCVAATADRCRDSLRHAEGAITRAAEIAAASGGDELVAAELRAALAELGHVVGTVYTDDLLDRIFKTFCIGK